MTNQPSTRARLRSQPCTIAILRSACIWSRSRGSTRSRTPASRALSLASNRATSSTFENRVGVVVKCGKRSRPRTPTRPQRGNGPVSAFVLNKTIFCSCTRYQSKEIPLSVFRANTALIVGSTAVAHQRIYQKRLNFCETVKQNLGTPRRRRLRSSTAIPHQKEDKPYPT